MARSYPWIVAMLLWLGSFLTAQASSRDKAPTAAGPVAASAPRPATGAALPAVGAPAPATAAPPSAAAAGSAMPPSAPAPVAAAEAGSPAGPAPVSGPPEPPPGASADQIADYAMGLFKLKRFSEAGDALQRAYQREPRPIFLFNVGQTYRKAGRYADAVTAYKRFTEAAPDHPLCSEARGYENTLTALVEQQERTSQIEMSLMDKQAEADRARQRLAVEQRKTEEAQSELIAEKARNKPFYRRPWFWGVVGGAAVAALTIGISIVGWNSTVSTPGMNQKFTFH